MNRKGKTQYTNTLLQQGYALELNPTNINCGRFRNKNDPDGYSWFGMFMFDEAANTTENVISPTTATIGFEATLPTSSTILRIASTSVNDIATTGTGARTIILQGSDANYNFITESINLNGQNEVVSTLSYFRLNASFIDESGTSNSNEGDISITDTLDSFTAGIPQLRVYNTIPAGHSLSKTGLLSVAGKRNFNIQNIYITTDATGSERVTIRVYSNLLKAGVLVPNTEYLLQEFIVDRNLVANLDYFFPKNKTEFIKVTAQTATGAVRVSARIDIIIKENHFRSFEAIQ